MENVGTREVRNNSITSEKLVEICIVPAKIDDEAIESNHLSKDSALTFSIADGAITSTKISNESVTQEKLQQYSVTNEKLQPNSVTQDKIHDHSVSHSKLTNSCV